MGLVYRLLEECWNGQQGYVFLPRKVEGKWVETTPSFWSHGGYQPMTVSLDTDQYFSPLVFSDPKRRKEYALPTHVLWADLDEADPEQCALRPSAAWQTTQGDLSGTEFNVLDASLGMDPWHERQKPHWQALWFLGNNWYPEALVRDEFTREEVSAEEAAQLSRRIAYAEGADKSGWDVTQVLRLPGTYNHKHTPPQRIELLWAERRYYTVAQVEAAYPSVPEAEPGLVALMAEPSVFDLVEAKERLPMGLQMALERPAGGDRSLEIMKLAEGLTRFGVETPVALALLERSPLVQSKYGGRRDMRARLLTALSDAFMVVHKEVQR